MSIDLDRHLFIFEGREKPFSDGISVVFVDPVEGEQTLGGWDVVFYPEGGNTGGEVRLSSPKNIYVITLDPVVWSVINELKE